MTRAFLLGLLCLVVAHSPPSRAHDLPYAVAAVSRAQDGQRTLTLKTHVPALIAGYPAAHLTDAQRSSFLKLKARELERLITAAANDLVETLYIAGPDGRLTIDGVVFPRPVSLKRAARATPMTPQPSDPIIIRFSDDDAETLEFAFPPSLGRVLLTIENDQVPPQAIFLAAGERSGQRSMRDPARTGPGLFLYEGVRHIVPKGLDHILFVIVLTVSTLHLSDLLKLVTAFTAAHSLSLGVAALGGATAPALIEPLIALSITIAALDNFRRRVPARQSASAVRLATIGAFGLLHGLGFAGALREIGLPEHRELVSLLAFNIGVEIGQLLVVGAVLLTVGWAVKRPFYRSGILYPASGTAAAVGLMWTVNRLAAMV